MTGRQLAALGDLVAALLAGEPAVPDEALPADAVRRHLLAPLAYRAGVAGFFRDYVAAALQAERREAFLIEAIGAIGVPVMLLKGIAYAGSIYADTAERPMTDIDLLVADHTFAKAAAGLRRAGYWDDGKRNQRSAANHAVTFRRHESTIDLHRNMVQRGRMGVDLDAVWRDARTVRHGALRPSPAHEYLIHVAHMARHELTVPLISFIDAARLREAAGDVAELARRWHLSRALSIVERSVDGLRTAGRRGVTHPGGSRPDGPPGGSRPDGPPGGSRPDRGWEARVFPGREELLAGGLPPRWLQIVRKVAVHDSVGDVVAFAEASVRTRLGV